MIATQAVTTRVARNMMGHEDPVTYFVIMYVFSKLGDLSGNFMT
jgi:hypothetical protein